MRVVFLFFILQFSLTLFAQEQQPEVRAVRTETAPFIDGIINDACWYITTPVTDFLQKSPYYGAVSRQRTEVRMLYDDEGVYFAVICFDEAADSILRQLGTRDEDLNADKFSVKIDPYNNRLDAYVFEVFASGPQNDSRMQDDAFNAVWKSETRINSDGWSVEMFIPYSALRFPKKEIQTWAIQFERQIRRHRETSQWALEEQNASNIMLSWGNVTGISGIDPPIRLSVNPYFTASVSHFPYHQSGVSDFSTSYGGGMDLKAGLSESYTVDVTLLPDFSQVQSDDLIKNLSAFETQYEEQRQFFKEAVDLFQRGGLFYSRRIGRTPAGFYDVYSLIDSTESVASNPSQARLINASKFSGRSKNGLAVGLFNAITNNTYAEIRQQNGEIRSILTDPRTNYNILVIDKEFSNSNSFYVINTNALRNRAYESSNVSGAGAGLYMFGKRFRLSGSVATSMNDTVLFSKSAFKDAGLAHSISIAKVRGKWTWTAVQNVRNDRFDYNDMGIMHMNNYLNYDLTSTHTWYNPSSRIKEMRLSEGSELSYRLSNGRQIGTDAWFRLYVMTMRHFAAWGGFTHSLTRVFNYYEPRAEGYYYKEPHWGYFYVGFSSSYSKPFALDGNVSATMVPSQNNTTWEISLSPLLKVGNHFQFRYMCETGFHSHEIGYAGMDTLGLPLFGARNMNVISNTLEATYVIRNYMPVTIRLRHYFTEGMYESYMPLLENGEVGEPFSEYYNYDFTFNSFNIDFVYSWQFAPGSSLNLIWKTAILNDALATQLGYLQNFSETLSSDLLNSVTLKVVYYLDYQDINKKKPS